MGLATKDGLKSRMRENRTSGSVRGVGNPFTAKKYCERSVETVYSTNLMEKFIYDEGNGLWYERQGDYYIPCLSLPEDDQPMGTAAPSVH